MNLNLTPAQMLALGMSTLSALAGASAQLTTLFGQAIATDITTLCALVSAIMGGWVVVLTGQTAQVKSVLAMPGVEKITVNAQANQTLSQIAVDPAVNKISPTPAAQDDVEKKASGT